MTQRLFAFTGRKGSGKDTAARLLRQHLEAQGHKTARVYFAQPLKDACTAMFGWTAEQMEDEVFKDTPDELTGRTPRYVLQKLGTEFGRDIVHSDIWRRIAQAKIKRLLSEGYHVTVTDLRFENEASLMESLGATVVLVINPEQPPLEKGAHISEHGIPLHYVTYVVENRASQGLEQLQSQIIGCAT